MNKKLHLSLILLVLFSMILSACGSAVQPTMVVVDPATTIPATEAPPTEVRWDNRRSFRFNTFAFRYGSFRDFT
jgi:hypothetical protein